MSMENGYLVILSQNSINVENKYKVFEIHLIILEQMGNFWPGQQGVCI